MASFVRGRVRQLAVPSLALALTWMALGFAVVARFDVTWMRRAVILVISPLWFIAAYLLIIVLFPVFHWLHRRFGATVLVFLVGGAWLVDTARFDHDISGVAMVNMVLVWGFCHQLGFFYERIVAAGRRTAWTFTWAGLFGLSALVYSGQYPGSMVGVPGDKFSNMGPPTICIVALVIFQAGVAILLRPWVLDRLEHSRRWARTNEVINGFSMPLFLFHTTGLAIAFWIGRTYLGVYAKRQPDLSWWLFRPLSFIGPLLATLPVIYLFGRRWVKGTG